MSKGDQIGYTRTFRIRLCGSNHPSISIRGVNRRHSTAHLGRLRGIGALLGLIGD